MKMFQDGNNDQEYTGVFPHWKGDSIEESMEADLLPKARGRFNYGPNSVPECSFSEKSLVKAIDNGTCFTYMQHLVRNIPNDQELGAAVREYINNLK